MPTTADYLKYANLQMAAEELLKDPDTGAEYYKGADLEKALEKGNDHALLFTQSQATQFSSDWEVVDQKSDTPTGFSGTLFKNRNTNEYVISFRSTEFIDDAIRDSAATNTLEVHDTGFAWGQISDMQDWYASIQSKITGPLSVTGYSLGGHLATTFNLLNPNAAQQVVTFNGAGVGAVKNGASLTSALATFTDLRNSPDAVKAALNLSLDGLSAFYDTLHQNLANETWTATKARGALADNLDYRLAA